MNCLLIAGEKSGEEHALSFIKELKSLLPELEFWGVGGDSLEKEGMHLIYHLNSFSSWGYTEVFSKIPFYLKALKNLDSMANEKKTKVAILIDFQEFNLKLAKKLSQRGVKVLYYVAPQVWVWKEYRIKSLKKYVHSLFTILPFEKNWFLKRGLQNVISAKHPLWFHYHKELEKFSFKQNEFSKGNKLKILLLPGSRNFEVSHLLPYFISTISEIKKNYDCEVGIVISPSVRQELISPYQKIFDQTFSSEELTSALKTYHFALAASGTVTLACALFAVPTIVCYQTSLLNSFIFRTFVSYNGPISLPNIVHEKRVFPELIQEEVSQYNILKELKMWITDSLKYQKIRESLKLTQKLLQGEEKSVAQYMAQVIKKS